MENKEVKRYVLIAFFLALLYASYLIIKPFVTALLASFILAYIFYPVYKKINGVVKKDGVSSAITTLLIILIILIPMIFAANIIFKEAVDIYKSDMPNNIAQGVAKYINEPAIAGYISSASMKIVEVIGNAAAAFILDIPSLLISIFITILTIFYLLINGEPFLKKVKELIPFKQKDNLIKHLGDSTHSIAYGFFVIAVMEFVISAIGLTLLGVRSPLIFAFLIGVSALFPFIGPALIVVPLTIMSLLEKSYFTAAGLVVMYLIIGYLENITRPKIISKTTNVHPMIVIIGLIGGVEIMGLVGVFAGPLILSALVIIIESYYSNYVED